LGLQTKILHDRAEKQNGPLTLNPAVAPQPRQSQPAICSPAWPWFLCWDSRHSTRIIPTEDMQSLNGADSEIPSRALRILRGDKSGRAMM